MTVFELEDLVRWASDPAKEVILMSRQCGLCRRIHTRALRPLLTEPSLKVFSRLVVDCSTAMELLKDRSRGRNPLAVTGPTAAHVWAGTSWEA